MSVPNRPADRTQTNVGKRYGPPQSTEFAPDNNFAGTTYVTGCSGNTATNPDQPPFRYELDDGTSLSSNNLIVTESDGTVKQYYVSGNEVATDFYIKNNGLTSGQYNALSQSQKNLYCSSPVGGTGGAVTGVKIVDRGQRLYAANNPVVNTGSGGAQITVTVNSAGEITGTNIVSGGNGYRVGRSFTVTQGKSSFAYPQSGLLEVTSVSGGSGGKYYLSNPSNSGTRVREVSVQLNVRIWDPADDNEDNNNPCQPTNTVVSTVSVVGNTSGTVYGNGPYRADSEMATAAVHAGLLDDGESGTIELLSAGPNNMSFDAGDCRNGVCTIGVGGANTQGCGINLRRKDRPSDDDATCNPISDQTTKQITVGTTGGQTRGGVGRFKLLNPFPRPFYLNTLPSGGLEAGQPNDKPDTEAATNWIYSCPAIPVAGCAGIPTQNYTWIHVAGPSINEPSSDPSKTNWRQGYKLKSYRNINDFLGCSTSICVNDEGDPKKYNFYVYDLPGDNAISYGSPGAFNAGTGWAVGDEFELRPADRNDEFYDTNFYPRIRIETLVDPVNTDDSTMSYTVQSDVGWKYNKSVPALDGFYDAVQDYVVSVSYNSTTDNLLQTSARLCVEDLFVARLGRNPTETDFLEFTRKIYADDGNIDRARADFERKYSNTLTGGFRVVEIIDCFSEKDFGGGNDNGDDDDDPIGGDTNCKYDRNTFYRGTGRTANGQVELYDLWAFLGSPRNNPNPVCPRPQNDSGLTQDGEPDMTDFAGMTLQKWKPCTDGSNNGNADLGSFDEIIVPCDGDLDLGFFIDTRIAPWWGTQELAPPSLSFTQTNDNIYMINIPPTQNEEYFFKATPATDSSGKKFFSVKGSINFPAITGQPSPGEPAIPTNRNTQVYWYKNPNSGSLRGEAYYDRLGRTESPGITNLNGNQMTVTGSLSSGESGNFETTLTLADAIDGKTTRAGAEELDFNTSGDVWVCRVIVDNRPDNPKAPGTFMPGFGGIVNNNSTYLNRQNKFLLNNIDCQDASIACSGNQQIEVKTNEPTTITFSMRISTNCLQYRSGTARISIKREWPCSVFGPADPSRNQWLVEKATVGIPQTSQSSALIQYTLTVPTDRQDYLPGEPGKDVNPGDCHWTYRAFWEIDYPGVDCRSNAWRWQGDDCQCGSGLLQLPEIFCSQQQFCENKDCGPFGNNKSNPSPSGSSGCQNTTGIPDNQFDFQACLPLCSSQSTAYFYWYYIQPIPGENCSGTVSNPSPANQSGNGPEPGVSPYGAGCECPVCEQSITVTILDGTDCGIMGKPNQQEGAGAGPNNAIVSITSPKEGLFKFTDYSFNPTILPKDVLKDCTNGPGKCLNFEVSSWVYLVRKTFNEIVTLGNDAAIRIVDYDKNEVDCSETVFTQESYYVDIKYKNGTSTFRALPIYLGGAEWDPYLNKYNPGAGSNTQAMLYRNEEVGNSSKKTGGAFIDDLPYDIETVKSMEILLNITSTNDYFGNVQYNPPPAGYFARDFGTTTTVTSPRGAVGASPGVSAQKDLFQIANFAVADIIDLPEFKSPAGISCPPSTVPYDGIRVTPDIFEFCCGGVIGGCTNFSTSFGCQIACESGGCDKQPLSGPKQEITATATNADGVFAIDWKEIKPAERKQLTILWYFGRAQFNPCCFNEGNLSQGDTVSPDINNVSKLAQPETSYRLGYYIVASSDGDVSYRDIQYDDTGPDGYGDRLSWLLTPNINSCNRPFQTTGEVKDGERWQTIMGSGFCTITTGPDLDTVSIEDPTGSISITNITNPDGSTDNDNDGPPDGFCSSGNCCNPANPDYYGNRCKEIRDALSAAGVQCCSTFPSPGSPGSPGTPSPGGLGPIRPF